MSYNYPYDAEPGESESEYRARIEAGKATDSLISMLFNFFFWIIKNGIIYCVFLYCSYLLSKHILGAEGTRIKQWLLTGLFTYLMLCVVFFLKGLIIGLRRKNIFWWKILWLLGVLITCFFPVLVIQSFVASFFDYENRRLFTTQLISWGIGVAAGLYIYNIYSFLTPVAPRIFYWSLVLGIRIAR